MKVQAHPNLRRDNNTGAVVNTNHNAYQNYLYLRNKNSKESEEFDTMKNDINSLKEDISSIKELLLKLAEK